MEQKNFLFSLLEITGLDLFESIRCVFKLISTYYSELCPQPVKQFINNQINWCGFRPELTVSFYLIVSLAKI
jgi:hypothetical protein